MAEQDRPIWELDFSLQDLNVSCWVKLCPLPSGGEPHKGVNPDEVVAIGAALLEGEGVDTVLRCLALSADLSRSLSRTREGSLSEVWSGAIFTSMGHKFT
jgi:hypothetical protein